MAMVFDICEQAKFYCFTDGIDMRKGIHSLYSLVRQNSDLDALRGDVFVFMGSNRKSIKVLWWQKDGFVLTYKRLEAGCFSLFFKQEQCSFIELKHPELCKMVARIRQRSAMNELRRRATLNC